MRSCRTSAMLGAIALLGALSCRDSKGPDAGPAASLIASHDVVQIELGDSLELRAEARTAAGAPLRSVTVEWRSIESSVATVSTRGVVRARAAGTARIVARAGRKSDTVMVTVLAPIVETMLSSHLETIPELRREIGVRISARSATAPRDGEYTVVSRHPHIAAARLDDVGDSLVIRGSNPGATWVVVRERGGTTDSIRVVVAQRARFIELQSLITIGAGSTTQLQATVRDVTGLIIPEPPEIRWTSADPAIVSVSPTGFARFLAPGLTTIEARIDDVAAIMDISVTPVAAPRVLFLADSPTVAVGTGLIVQRSVTVLGPNPPPAITVVSLDPTIATVADVGPGLGGTVVTIVGKRPGVTRLVATAGSLEPDTLGVRVATSRLRFLTRSGGFAFSDEAITTGGGPQSYGIVVHDSTGESGMRAEAMTVTLRSSDPSVLRVAEGSEGVTLDRGFMVREVTVHPVAPGRVWLHATSPGLHPDSIAITVGDRPRLRFRPERVHTVALGYETNARSHTYHQITTNVGANPGADIPISLQRTNPGIARVSPLVIPRNWTEATIEYAGLALGVDTIIASAPGYDPDTVILIVTSPRLAPLAPISGSVGSQGLFALQVTDSLGLANIPLDTVELHVTSSDNSVARPPLITRIPRGMPTAWTATAGAYDTGTATITVSDPTGRIASRSTVLTVRPDTTLYFLDMTFGTRPAIGMRQRFSDDAFAVSGVRIGQVVYLRSTDPTVLRVPDSVVIQSHAPEWIPVEGGGAPGTASVVLSSRGYRTRVSNPFEVGRPTLDLFVPDSMYVGGSGYTMELQARDQHGVMRRTAEQVSSLLRALDGGLVPAQPEAHIGAGTISSGAIALSATAPGLLRLEALDSRSVAHRYDGDTATIRAILPPLTFDAAGPIVVGIGQRATTTIVRPVNLTSASAAVAIERRGSRTTSDPVVVMPAGEQRASYDIVGRAAGIDTLMPSAAGYAGRPVRVIVTEGRLHFPGDVPGTLQSGQSFAMRFMVTDSLGTVHPVASATTFQLWGSGVTFSQGGRAITSITIPAGTSESPSFDVTGSRVGEARLEVTNLAYRTARFEVTIVR